MTSEEAIKVIEKLSMKQSVTDDELWNATIRARYALSKEIPHKFYEPDHQYCGVCHQLMDWLQDHEGRQFKYCPLCGNKFSYGDNEEFQTHPYMRDK